MKKWIQKFLVSAVTVVTLGVITPSHTVWNSILDSEASAKSSISEKHEVYMENSCIIEQPEIDFVLEAKEQSYQKFGTKIGPKIQDDFETMIFPKMQEAIDQTVEKLGIDNVKNLAITENPSGNYSEKIFNIYNMQTGKDIIRFHVRTENRPLEGYFYNFHYHTSEDDFFTHYNLGDVYWSKNTPPKWLS